MMMKLLLLLDDGLRAPIQSREKWSNRQEVRDRRKERAGPALNVNIFIQKSDILGPNPGFWPN